MSAHDPLTYPDLRHLLSKLEHEDPAAQPRPLRILTDSPGRPEAEGIPFPREKEARTYVERQMIHDTQPRAVRRPQQLPRNRNAISEAEARPAGRAGGTWGRNRHVPRGLDPPLCLCADGTGLVLSAYGGPFVLDRYS